MSRSSQRRVGIEPHTSGSRPQLRSQPSLGPPHPRAVASAPALVRADAALRARAPHPRPQQPRNGHRTLVWRSTYLGLLGSSDSSPRSSRSRRFSCVSVASVAGPAPARVGACALEPYCVTRAQTLRFACVSDSFSFSSNIQTEKSNIFKEPHFSPHYSQRHINSGLHIELFWQKMELQRREET